MEQVLQFRSHSTQLSPLNNDPSSQAVQISLGVNVQVLHQKEQTLHLFSLESNPKDTRQEEHSIRSIKNI